MKISVLVFVISVAYISSSPTPNTEKHIEGNCFYKNINIQQHAIGATPFKAPLGDCHGVECFDGKNNGYVLHGCSRLVDIPKNCKYTENEDLTFSWPDCCPKLVCQK